MFSFSKAHEDENLKWLPRWLGPFKILRAIGALNYEITDGKKTNLVHVNRIRPYASRTPDIQLDILPAVSEESDSDLPPGVFEVENIIAHKKIRGQTRYLIKWRGYDSSHNTWEPAMHINPETLHQY